MGKYESGAGDARGWHAGDAGWHKDHWREIVENGAHELCRDFDGETLTISKLDIPGIGLLPARWKAHCRRTVDRQGETVERIMSSRTVLRIPNADMTESGY